MLDRLHYDSPLGGITLVADRDSLLGLWFDWERYLDDALRTLGSTRSVTEGESKPLDLASQWMDDYFDGKRPDSSMVPLRFDGTPFRRKVWSLLRDVPYGETVTYGELAHRLEAMNGDGRRVSARAVGGAVGHNPISIIVPCHRVVGSDGSLTGYAGGLDTKVALLELERNGGDACRQKLDKADPTSRTRF
ncbi:methylated-DNA--[protein]-cysteine S-methyltransferase [Bifidobacterium sp.]|uniref:methylated-DNA--[protein]-cysteine S-methyltransferase n=1 Tax=Bifidobacterium sp. TaxID=41200 RepID=UPI003D7DE004